jgi:hypothetical protein
VNDVSAEGIVIPIAGMSFTIAIIGLIFYYRHERLKIQSSGGGDYHKLADEAVRGQRLVLEEVQRMNQTLKEIERLLREV